MLGLIVFLCLAAPIAFSKVTSKSVKFDLIGWLALTFSLAVAGQARADIFLDSKPTSTITASEAGKSKTPVYKCQSVKSGPNIDPVKVKGSKTIWSNSVGAGIENGGDLLAEGKKIFRCKSVQMDSLSAKMRKAEDLE